MKVKFAYFLTILTILFLGCGGDNPTEPEEQLDLSAPELAPLLNTLEGRQFAEEPWDVNNDGKIDILDLVMVAQHLGEEVQADVQGEPGEESVLRIISGDSTGRRIQVTGSGSTLGKPDIVVLTLSVSVEKASVKEAREEAANAMNQVLDSLKGNGVAEGDIQTQQFSIQQQFDFTNGRREFRGYRVTNAVSAKSRDLDRIGQVIDDAAAAGGDLVQIQSIQFGIEDAKELQAQARVEAMRDALAKAQVLAAEGGVTLGKPISISESSALPLPTFPIARGLVEDVLATTPIETGQLQVNVIVNVVYEIE